VDDVRHALAEVGFREVRLYDAERELGLPEQVGRVFFATRKEQRGLTQ
jgi:hypothetical protein